MTLDHDEPSPDRRPTGTIGRRRVLATTGAAVGALWIAPSVLSYSAAAASSTLAVIIFTNPPVHIQGNAVKNVPPPTGTGTMWFLVVTETSQGNGTNALPMLTGPDVFTSPPVISSTPTGVDPYFGVWQSSSTPSATGPTLQGNDTKGRWTATIIGFSTGTQATLGTIGYAAAQPISLPGVTAPVASSWVFVGTASDGAGPLNWSTPAGYTKIIDFDGNNNTPPDLFIAEYPTVTTTAPGVVANFGAGQQAKGIIIGVG